uniref:Serpentine receptor class gamma n=1 Tax=Globodera rostochiensis TaxID=31243 RepID=A0A914HUB1_GLORO
MISQFVLATDDNIRAVFRDRLRGGSDWRVTNRYSVSGTYIAEIVTIVRHKKFHKSFYALFVMRAISDLMYVLTSYCANRLPSMIGLFFTQHTFQATNLVTAFILLNRLTAIIMPLKHEKLWCKFLPFITMFVFWTVPQILRLRLCRILCHFYGLCVLINIATFVAYKLHVKNSNNNNGIEIEKKLLVYALATFFGHMLLASYYLSFTIINLDDPKQEPWCTSTTHRLWTQLL